MPSMFPTPIDAFLIQDWRFGFERGGRAGVAVTSTGNVVFETRDRPYEPANHLYSDSVISRSGKDLKLADYFYAEPHVVLEW